MKKKKRRFFQGSMMVLLNLVLCVVFFLLSSIPEHGIYMSGWHLSLFLILYPLTAAGYGVFSMLASLGDMRYFLLMSATFSTAAVLNALTMEIVALPAAFVYMAIMLAAALLTALLRAAIAAYLSYRRYGKRFAEDAKTNTIE